MHGFDGIMSGLSGGESDESAASRLSVAVSQHRALLDGPEGAEHLPDVLFRHFLGQHADEQLAFFHVAVFRIGGLHLDRVMHARQSAHVVQRVLRLQSRLPRVERHETTP